MLASNALHKHLRPWVAIKPLAGDRFELPEQMELGLFARISPLGFKQALGEVEQQC